MSAELKAEKGDFVALSYTLTLDDGKVMDSTENKKGGRPGLFETELGTGDLLAGVENAIVGLAPGEQTKVRLGVEEAFGPYNPDLSFTLPKSQLGPQAAQMEAGMKVQLATGDVARISEVTSETVTIDANHPLAGEALNFDIALDSIAAKAGDVETMTVAGGCFWGLELAYQRVPGVLGTAVGYTQGQQEDPTYQEVCSGATGHTEAVRVKYDPKVVDYAELLDVFFGRVNPTQLNRQGNDVGTQYRSGIYFHNALQELAAKAALEKAQDKYDDKIVVECLPADQFWMAEEYHQQYLEKGGQDASKGAEETIRCYG